MLAMSGATRRATAIADLGLIQSSVPAFAAYGLMSACYNNPGISMVIRRETGLLKRLRLSPNPSWALVGAILANAAVISIVQVVVLPLIGRYGDGVVLRHVCAPFILAIAVDVSPLPRSVPRSPLSSALRSPPVRSSASSSSAGCWSRECFPLTAGSGLAKLANDVPIHHLILATAAPFDARGASPYAWRGRLFVARWHAAGSVLAVRRFRWEPHRL